MENLRIYEEQVTSGITVEVSKASDFSNFFKEMGFNEGKGREWGGILEKLLEDDRGRAFFMKDAKQLSVAFVLEGKGTLDLEIRKKGVVLPVSVGVKKGTRQESCFYLNGDLKDMEFSFLEPGFPSVKLTAEDGGQLEITWYSGQITARVEKGRGYHTLR